MSVLIFLAILVGAGLFCIGLYNGLVVARNAYRSAFGKIDVQLKRRYDLIPSLVETAVVHMGHESNVLEAVTQARDAAASDLSAAKSSPGDATLMRQLASADKSLTHALGRLFSLADAYPDLKADQDMVQLGEELASTENKIAFARHAYNDAVAGYNSRRTQFPGSIIAGLFQFPSAEALNVEPVRPPDVSEAPSP